MVLLIYDWLKNGIKIPFRLGHDTIAKLIKINQKITMFYIFLLIKEDN